LTFTTSIENLMIPDYYSKSLEVTGAIELVLMKSKSLGRHVLVVKSLDEILDLSAEIAIVRNEVSKLTNAFWIFREVGAYIVFRVNELPELKPSDIKVDRTGFHAVIVQGVHFVSASGQHLYNHTKWLNHTFGGGAGIAQRIESIET
jgi:hypothetical protein